LRFSETATDRTVKAVAVTLIDNVANQSLRTAILYGYIMNMSQPVNGLLQ